MSKYIFPFHLPLYNEKLDKTLSKLVDIRMSNESDDLETFIDLFVMKAYNLEYNEIKAVNKTYANDKYKDVYDTICLNMDETEIDGIIKQYFN